MSSKWNALIGSSIHSYELKECIGRGGMAVVYKAYQPMLDRFVAIKLLADHLLEDLEATQRILREARAIGRLEHPHILPVYDCGLYEGCPYIVMKYIKGNITLKEWIKQARPGAKESCDIVLQILDALAFAHRHGVIHRDLKPSNILMEGNGWVYLADFGIAQLMHEDTTLTQSGILLGTPEYMAPEQVEGTRADHRADLYATGIILYQLLTGDLPFTGDTPALVPMKQMQEDPVLDHSLIPGYLRNTLARALAKDPQKRLQDADEFRTRLSGAMRLPDSITIPVEMEPPVRRKIPWLFLPFLVVLLCGGAVLYFQKLDSDLAAATHESLPTAAFPDAHSIPAPQTEAKEQAPPAPPTSETKNPEQQTKLEVPQPKRGLNPTPPPMSSPKPHRQVAEPELSDPKNLLLRAISNKLVEGRITAVAGTEIEIAADQPLRLGMLGVIVSMQARKPLARVRITRVEGSVATGSIMKGIVNPDILQGASVLLFPPVETLKRFRDGLSTSEVGVEPLH